MDLVFVRSADHNTGMLNWLKKERRPAAGDVVQVADHPVRLAVNARSRRITLRVDAKAGEIVAVAPHVRLLPAAIDFAASKPEWIATRLARLPRPQTLQAGGTVPFLGRDLRITPGARRAMVAEDVLYVRGGDARAGAAAISHLKVLARTRAQDRLHAYAQQLGARLNGVRLADPRARWGSCTSDGRIMLSWRLIMAPEHVFDYVAAHEACHLIHPDHSDRFWGLLEQLYGDVTPAKAWLKAHGGRLHAVTA